MERILNRQDLAMKLFVRDGFGPREAFNAADLFIAECERQRKQPEPPKCEHRPGWTTNMVYCAHCGEDLPEPAPKREARPREWDACVSPNDWVLDSRLGLAQDKSLEVIRVREILE